MCKDPMQGRGIAGHCQLNRQRDPDWGLVRSQWCPEPGSNRHGLSASGFYVPL